MTKKTKQNKKQKTKIDKDKLMKFATACLIPEPVNTKYQVYKGCKVKIKGFFLSYLFWIVLQGWHDGLYYLLAKGANCLIADNCGRLPLHAATYFSNEKYIF